MADLQPGQIEQGYAASGRKDDDLALAVRRISEFARKFRDERDAYRSQAWALEALVSELQQEIAILRQALQ